MCSITTMIIVHVKGKSVQFWNVHRGQADPRILKGEGGGALTQGNLY